MMAAHLVNKEVLSIPESWDCFRFQGWLWRRNPSTRGFYRERFLGD